MLVTKNDIERAREYIVMYQEAAQEHKDIAKICAPNARGGARAAVTKNLKGMRRWEELLAAKLGWLATNDKGVFHEVKEASK